LENTRSNYQNKWEKDSTMGGINKAKLNSMSNSNSKHDHHKLKSEIKDAWKIVRCENGLPEQAVKMIGNIIFAFNKDYSTRQ